MDDILSGGQFNLCSEVLNTSNRGNNTSAPRIISDFSPTFTVETDPEVIARKSSKNGWRFAQEHLFLSVVCGHSDAKIHPVVSWCVQTALRESSCYLYCLTPTI